MHNVLAGARRGPRFEYLTDYPTRGESARYAWRLHAANFRAVGRAVAPERSLALCVSAATRVHDATADLANAVTLLHDKGVWSWRTQLDQIRAMSVRAYARRVECVRAFDQFIEAAATADPDAGVVRSFGPDTLRSYDTPSAVTV